MPFFLDLDHVLQGHVDDSLHQFDAQGAAIGGTEVHGYDASHFDAQHGLLGTSEHHAGGTLGHYDQAHHLVGTTEHHGDIAYHFDGSHHVLGTEQHVGGGLQGFDGSHVMTSAVEGPSLGPLQRDLATAFRRLF